MQSCKMSEEYIDKARKRTMLVSGLIFGMMPIMLISFLVVESLQTGWDVTETAVMMAISLVFILIGIFHSKMTGKKVRKLWESYEVIITDDVIVKKESGKKDIVIQFEDIDTLRESSKYLWIQSKNKFEYLSIPTTINDYDKILKVVKEAPNYQERKKSTIKTILLAIVGLSILPAMVYIRITDNPLLILGIGIPTLGVIIFGGKSLFKDKNLDNSTRMLLGLFVLGWGINVFTRILSIF